MAIEIDRDKLRDELIKVLFERRASPDTAYMTTAEISMMMGWSQKKVLTVLKELKEKGLLEIKKVNRESLTGTIQPVPGYRVKPQETSEDEV